MQKNTQNLSRKNIHIPLTGELYDFLSEEAERMETTITQVARQAISDWFLRHRQQEVDESVKNYAQSCAGVTDLDPALEKVAAKHLFRK